MILGIDFDNTLVSYDAIFHRVALERGLIPSGLPMTKTAVRDHLRATGREPLWTEMQGYVYGPRLADAEPFPGVKAFFAACRAQGVPVFIISHKTRHPCLGDEHDLHAAARNWLDKHGFHDAEDAALPASHVFLEVTKLDKINRIAECGCTHFIDDLPELLTAPQFPSNVERFLFDPQCHYESLAEIKNVSNWSELYEDILGDVVAISSAIALTGLDGSRVHRSIAGGANNRILRLGEIAVVKRYFRHPGDLRDRFSTEKSFYDYAVNAVSDQIPRVLGWDHVNGVGVFEFVKGTRPQSSVSNIDSALRFFARLNTHRDSDIAKRLPLAAEACLTFGDHLATVHRRVTSLADFVNLDALDVEANAFVANVINPLWDRAQSQLTSDTQSLSLQAEISPGEKCISPSDFGFHNALEREDGTIVFFDFEYAGWDDPAKFVNDFFCQPDVPISIVYYEYVVVTVSNVLGVIHAAEFMNRCRRLFPLYQIKWGCILLNDFTHVGRERREYSLGLVGAASRRKRQLDRARQLLNNYDIYV